MSFFIGIKLCHYIVLFCVQLLYCIVFQQDFFDWFSHCDPMLPIMQLLYKSSYEYMSRISTEQWHCWRCQRKPFILLYWVRNAVIWWVRNKSLLQTGSFRSQKQETVLWREATEVSYKTGKCVSHLYFVILLHLSVKSEIIHTLLRVFFSAQYFHSYYYACCLFDGN